MFKRDQTMYAVEMATAFIRGDCSKGGMRMIRSEFMHRPRLDAITLGNSLPEPHTGDRKTAF